MPRQDHWNKVGEGEGEPVWELCDMVSVNIINCLLICKTTVSWKNFNLHTKQNIVRKLHYLSV